MDLTFQFGDNVARDVSEPGLVPGAPWWLCGVRRGDNIIQDKEIYIPTFCKVFIFADGHVFNIQICQVRLNYAFQGDTGRRALLAFSLLPGF